MISIPARVLWADSNSLNPVLMAILLLIFRWSCSTILFKYLHCRHLISLKFRLLNVLIPSLFAQLLSIFITLGFPLLPMALFKNFWADPFILLFLIGSLWYPHIYLQLYKDNDPCLRP